jgi:hypothetical protein
MSEQLQMPPDLAQFSGLEAKVYENGARHVYGIDDSGKKVHLKGDDVLAAYGYGPEDLGSPSEPDTPDRITDTPKSFKEGEYSGFHKPSAVMEFSRSELGNDSGTDIVPYEPNEIVPIQPDTDKPGTDIEPWVEKTPALREVSPEYEKAQEVLEVARERLAQAAANRSRRLFSLKRGERMKEYEAAKAEHDAALKEVAKLALLQAKEIKPDLNEDEAKQMIRDGILTERDILDTMKQERLGDTKFGKFLNWYKNASGAKRFFTALGMGAAGTAFAGVAGLAGGVIGAGGVMTGGAVAATRFARGFLNGSRKHLKDSASEDQAKLSGKLDNAENIDDAFSQLGEVLDARISGDQKKMRRAVRSGLAGLAVGAGIGLVLERTGVVGDATDWLKERFGIDSKAPNKVGSNSERPSGPNIGNNTPDVPTDADQLIAYEDAMSKATDSIKGVEGQYPWDRATALYGGDGSQRLISAVQKLQEEGVDVKWHGNPLTDETAWIDFGGHSDTQYVWDRLAPKLAQEDFENWINAKKS